MEEVYFSIGRLMDVLGIVISFTLVYYQIYFRNKGERTTQQYIPNLVFLLCLIEFADYFVWGKPSLALLDEVLATGMLFIECLLLCLTVQLLIENTPFVTNTRVRKGFRITWLTFFGCLILSKPIHIVYDLFYYGLIHPIVWDHHIFTHLRLVLIFYVFLVSIVLLILCRIKKEKAARHYVAIIFVMMAIYFFTTMLQGLVMPGYISDGIGFALGFSFLFTISNTKFLMAGKEKEAAIAADLNMAQRIQQDALPKAMPAYMHHQDVSLNAFMATAKDVGGDFYDYFEIDENHICFLIADVSGKGMPASLFMMTSQTMIKTLALKIQGTDEIIHQADQMLTESNASMMFVTVWIGILNTDTLELEYTNAGHNPPVLIHPDGTTEMMEVVNGTVVGNGMSDTFTKEIMKVNTGDRIFLYTDGVPEAHNTKEELFGEDRMIAELQKHHEDPGHLVLQSMREQVNEFSNGRDPFDDITMMIVDFNLKEAPVDSFDGLSFLSGLGE